MVDTLVFWAKFAVVAFVVINALAIAVVTLFPAAGRDWGLPKRRFGR